jgi:hypothetical protein
MVTTTTQDPVAQFNELVAYYVAGGLSKPKAIERVAKEHPELKDVAPDAQARIASESAAEQREHAGQASEERMAASKVAARAQYVAILRRRNSPHRDDAANLPRVMEQLHIDSNVMQTDVAAFDQADKLAQQAAPQATLKAELERARAEAIGIEEQLRDAGKRVEVARRAHRDAFAAAEQLKQLKAVHPALFPATA